MNARRLAALFVAVILGAVNAPIHPAAAVVLPAGFSLETAAAGFDTPTSVDFAADGTIFVTEKRGRVFRLDGPNDQTRTLVADLINNVHNHADRGLTGLAVDPSFPAQPYLYVAYSLDRLPSGGPIPAYGVGNNYDPCPDAGTTGCPIRSRVSRLDMSNNAAEQVLFEGHCQQFPFHSTGDVFFDNAGNLLVSFGDGSTGSFVEWGQRGNICGDPPSPAGTNLESPTAEGGQGRAQDIFTRSDPTGVHGSLLRVNKATFAPVAGNPLAGDGELNAERMIAHGFRNPFRATVDPTTGTIYVGNVGGVGKEEIQQITDPGTLTNGGWPCYEGPVVSTSFFWGSTNLCANLVASAEHDAPLFSYERNEPIVPGEPCSNGGLSVSGLAMNRSAFGTPGMNGGLFFTDYTRSCVWYLPSNGAGGVRPEEPRLFASDVGALVDLQFAPDGNLYAIDIAGDKLVRFTYATGALPPVASFTATPSSGAAPLTVALDASASFDPNPGDTLTYFWDTDGDGTTDAEGVQTTVTYTTDGTRTVDLMVLDQTAESGTASQQIVVGGAPVITVINPVNRNFKVGGRVHVQSSSVTANGDPLPASASSWVIVLNHCIPGGGCHTHDLDGIEGPSGVFIMPDHEYPSDVELQLTVNDPAGGTATATAEAVYRTVNLNVQSEPTGLSVVVGSTEEVAPFTRQVAVGATTSVSVNPEQSLNGQTLTFARWLVDGAEASTNPGIELAPAVSTTIRSVFSGGVDPDTERPVSPKGLKGTASPDGIALNWRPATDNVGVTNHLVFRSTDGTLGPLVATIGNVAEWTDTDVVAGTAYTYSVRGRDAAGNLSWRSNFRTLTATGGQPPDTMRPSSPRGLMASSVPSGVRLTWTASTDNVGVTDHLVFRSTNGTYGPFLTLTSSSGAEFIDQSAQAGVAYTYAVKSTDAAGNTSWRSNLRTITFTP